MLSPGASGSPVLTSGLVLAVESLLYDGESSVQDEARTALEQLEDPMVLGRLQTLMNDGFLI